MPDADKNDPSWRTEQRLVHHFKNRKGHWVLLLAWKSKEAKDAKKTKNLQFYVFGVLCIYFPSFINKQLMSNAYIGKIQ